VSQENVEVVRNFMASPNAGDWDAMFAWFAPDVQLRDLAHAPDVPEVLNWPEEIRRVMAGWIETYDEFRTEVYEYVDAGAWVICDTRWYGKGKGKGSGMEIDQRVADAYQVRTEKSSVRS
jgi:ketosteroid isomerase-like protein